MTAILSDHVARGFQSSFVWLTDKVKLQGGYERRNKVRANPMRVFTLAYDSISDDVVKAVRAHHIDMRGDWTAWLIKDWTHYSVTGQALGLGDGAETDFQCVVTFGTTNPYDWTARHLKSGTLKVYVDGVLQSADSPADYSVSDTGLITFTSAPANGAAVTADFEYYVLVRFDGDSLAVNVKYVVPDALGTDDLTAIEVLE